MRVICNGYKNCVGGCEHGVPHECNEPCYNKSDPNFDCNCSQEYYIDVRKKKLEKLNNESNLRKI